MPSLATKWRSFQLSHLNAPPSLLPALLKSVPCVACPCQRLASCVVPTACPFDSACGLTLRSPLHPDSAVAPPCDSSSPLSTDVALLLHTCLDRSHDLHSQTKTLDTLYTLCSTTLDATDICVASGGVELLLSMLSSSPQPQQAPLIPSLSAERSEKALRLLYLITSSKAGCAAALRYTNAIITTLGKKLLRVSDVCTASVISILLMLSCHSEAALFRAAVSETAIPSKLVVVLQVTSKESTKRRAGRLLRLLAEHGQPHKSG